MLVLYKPWCLYLWVYPGLAISLHLQLFYSGLMARAAVLSLPDVYSGFPTGVLDSALAFMQLHPHPAARVVRLKCTSLIPPPSSFPPHSLCSSHTGLPAVAGLCWPLPYLRALALALPLPTSHSPGCPRECLRHLLWSLLKCQFSVRPFLQPYVQSQVQPLHTSLSLCNWTLSIWIIYSVEGLSFPIRQ